MTSETLPGTAPAQAPVDTRGRRIGRFQLPRWEKRYLAPILITLILLGGNAVTGMLESPWYTGLAIVTAILFEALLGRTFLKKWPNIASAYITGISVGILVRSPYAWPYALTSAIAITSKYVIRYRGRHIFNPSNFAIVVMIVLASAVVATLSHQWDNQLWLMLPIWAVGLMVLHTLKRLHITLTYILSFLFFAALRVGVFVLVDGVAFTPNLFLAEVAPLTGPMYQLFAMFMVTDPATTVASRRGQILVVILVAAMECLLRLALVVHAPYFALFLVGPPALVYDRWRRAKAAPAPAV